MNRRRGYVEVSLNVGLGRGPPIDLVVVVDEGEVLTLTSAECGLHAGVFVIVLAFDLSGGRQQARPGVARSLDGEGWASLSARPELWRPHTQGEVQSSEFEVVVGAQECQIVANAQLSE